MFSSIDSVWTLASRAILASAAFLSVGCKLEVNPLAESSSSTDSGESEGTATVGSADDTDTSSSADTSTTEDIDTGTDTETDTDTGTEPVCGDGLVEGEELCDDGNDDEADGCEPSCTPTTVISVGLYDYTTCVVFGSGHGRCWGDNYSGELGLGHTDSIGDDEPPWSGPLLGLEDPLAEIAGASGSVCARLAEGDVRCWGRGNRGQLGTGSTESLGDDELPWLFPPVDFGGTASQIDVGTNFVCLVDANNAVKCWGHNDVGQLGYGHVNDLGDDEVPSAYGNVALGEPIQAVATGLEHACALTFTGAVICWGSPYGGKLGYGNGDIFIGDDEAPANNVLPPGAVAKQVTTGNQLTCALLETDEVLCWGQGYSGELGTGSTLVIGDDETPSLANTAKIPVEPIEEIASGSAHTCARYTSGDLYCWGYGSFGQLGYGSPDYAYVGDDELPSEVGPVPIGGPVDRVWANENETCARRVSGELYCWGYNHMANALGYDTTELLIGDDETPEQMGPVPLFGE